MRSVVATLAAALVGGAVAQQLPASCSESADAGPWTATPAQLLECIGAVTWDIEARRSCSLQLLMHQLGQVYGYTGLQRDSTAAQARVSEPFRDVLVPYESNLGPEIDALAAELETEPSMGTFAYKVSRLLTRFKDAHTGVNFGALAWNCMMSIGVKVGINETGAQAVFVYGWRQWVGHTEPRPKGEVLTINDRPAIEYLLEVAASAGVVKDAGVALNMFLRQPSLSGPVLPPDDGVLKLVFADGTEISSEWRCSRPWSSPPPGVAPQPLWSRDLDEMQSLFADFDGAEEAATNYGVLAMLGYEMFCDELFDEAAGRRLNGDAEAGGRRLNGDAEAPPRTIAALFAHDAKRLARRRQLAQPAGSSERRRGADLVKEAQRTDEARRRLHLDEERRLLQLNYSSVDNFIYDAPDCHTIYNQMEGEAITSAAGLRAIGAQAIFMGRDESGSVMEGWKFCQLRAGSDRRGWKYCSVLGVLDSAGMGTIVLKIVGFAGGDPDAPNRNGYKGGKYFHNVACAQAAVDVAQAIGGGKLMIDVAGNGGGDITEGYLLNDFLYRGMAKATSFANPIDSCEWYDFPKNAPLKWLVPALQLGYPDISAVADPQAYIEAYRGRLQQASPVKSPMNNGGYMRTHDCLGTLLCAYDPFPAKGTEAFDNMAAQFTMCAKSGVPRVGFGFGGYDPSNCKPELSDAAAAGSSPLSVEYPRAVAAAPSWEFFDKGVDKGLDQEVPEFTSRAFFPDVCPAYLQQHGAVDDVKGQQALEWMAKPQTGVSQITYFSDGFCGSTCSVSTTRPVLEGLASVVTYGGIKGVPNDITSFNGGNLYGNYQGLATANYHAAIDLAVHNPDNPKPGREAIMLPLPLAVSSAKFAQRAQYPTVLGDHALPREWYKVPAPNHIDIWATDNPTYYKQDFDDKDVEGLISPNDMGYGLAPMYIAAAKKEYRTLVPPAGGGRTLADGEDLAKCPAAVPFGKHGAACASDDDCDVTTSCACEAAGGARELLFASTGSPPCVCK